jgi:hypothetical protein
VTAIDGSGWDNVTGASAVCTLIATVCLSSGESHCCIVRCIFASRKCVISGFRRGAVEILAVVGRYTACSGSYLPTFWYNLSVPGKMGCPEPSVSNYQYTGAQRPRRANICSKECMLLQLILLLFALFQANFYFHYWHLLQSEKQVENYVVSECGF